MTNLEYIHSVSTTELAEIMNEGCKECCCDGCLVHLTGADCSRFDTESQDDFVDWLNSEYKGEEEYEDD